MRIVADLLLFQGERYADFFFFLNVFKGEEQTHKLAKPLRQRIIEKMLLCHFRSRKKAHTAASHSIGTHKANSPVH